MACAPHHAGVSRARVHVPLLQEQVRRCSDCRGSGRGRAASVDGQTHKWRCRVDAAKRMLGTVASFRTEHSLRQSTIDMIRYDGLDLSHVTVDASTCSTAM